jgi:hypothetical protein
MAQIIMPKGFYKRSDEIKNRLRSIAGNRLGTKQTQDHINKRLKFAEKHWGWKGDEVGYSALHKWANKNVPKPEKCNNCKQKPPYDLANISQKYLRVISDWEWLCRSCHMKKDGRLNILHKNRIGTKHSEETKRKIGLASKLRCAIPPYIKNRTPLPVSQRLK